MIIHPHLKNSLKNLNLDLGAELNRYEQYLNSLPQVLSNQQQLAIPALEQQISLTDIDEEATDNSDSLPPLIYETEIIDTKRETKPIPVASRIITNQKSLLDILLTPWGMFGVIIFFSANLFLIVSHNVNQQAAQELASKNDNQLNNNQSNNLNLSDKTNQVEIIENLRSQQRHQPPSLPMPLSTLQEAQTSNNDNNQPVMYSDLKTALLTEAKNYQLQLPPPPLDNYRETKSSVSSPTNTNQNYSPPTNNSNPSASHSSPKNNSNPSASQSSPKNNSNPSASQSSPTNNPNPSAQVATTTANSQSQLIHYVVLDYQGIENYAQVKAIVSEAFVTNIGEEMKIQLSSFQDKSGAEEYSQQLKKQGLDAQIISTNNE